MFENVLREVELFSLTSEKTFRHYRIFITSMTVVYIIIIYNYVIYIIII